MPELKRRIGLSLGADLCWPICYEEILRRLKLQPYKGQEVSVQVDRVSIEPFDLRQPSPYDVVLDRITHWYPMSREWLKKAILMNDLYILNNPWSLVSMEKHTTYCAMMHLGLPVPDTWMIPPREYPDPHADLQATLERYAHPFDLGAVGDQLGYPSFMKPHDGGAWVGVNKIDGRQELEEAYADSGGRLMHVQKAVLPNDLFVRCLGVGPQVRPIKYNPDAALHKRYEIDFNFLEAEEAQTLRDMTLTINTFFGWDFNSCEALRQDGDFHPIDFANACPDSQVTSLHYHFPWLVTSMVRWSLFCALTDRKMHKNLDWDPYYEVAAEEDLSYPEKLRRYGEIASRRLDVDRFEEFSETYIPHLDEVAWEFFGTERAREAVRLKVESLFPAHEHDEFTDHFWGLIQFWRETEADRLELTPST